VFENLGFSTDGRVFLFGQYGVEEEGGTTYADLYAVDVDANDFVAGGEFSLRDDRPLTLGQNGQGALFTLVGRARTLAESYDVDHLETGRPIYILVDGDEPRARISFRDFNSSIRYELELIQSARGADDDSEASFHIQLTLTYPDDRVRTKTLGLPGYYRPGVAGYRITQVLLNPPEDALVVVVEKRAPDGSTRYMVETAPLD
jgi:predicted secreted protein